MFSLNYSKTTLVILIFTTFLLFLIWGCGNEDSMTRPILQAPGDPEEPQFNKVWSICSCTGTAAGEGNLWDDAPGAGVNNESGLFWVVTNDTGDEKCTAGASGEGVSTTTYPNLMVRAAVNDGAILKVELRAGSEFCGGGTIIASTTISGTSANSSFITKNVALPAGNNVSEVCVTLDDNPNNIGSQRASALIDEIKIWKSSTGAVGWRETFSRAN